MAEAALEQAAALGVTVHATNGHLSFDGHALEEPEFCDRLRDLTPEIWEVLARRDQDKGADYAT